MLFRSNRTDLQQARKNLQVNDVTLKYLNNQMLPQADVVARYGLVGQGGTQFLTSGTGISRVVTGTIPGGYGDALSTLFGRNSPAGVMKFDSAKPTKRLEGYANIGFGRWSAVNLEAAVNVPVDSDLQLRVAGLSQRQSNRVHKIGRAHV